MKNYCVFEDATHAEIALSSEAHSKNFERKKIHGLWSMEPADMYRAYVRTCAKNRHAE